MYKSLGAAFAAACLLLLTPTMAVAVVPPEDSGFDSGAEGWQHQVRGGNVSDVVAPPTAVTWIPNPGDGYIQLTAPSEGLYSYWLAPAEYSGDLRLYEGGGLAFSLRSNVAMEPGFITVFPGAGHDVEIDGAGQRIHFNLPDVTYPANVWHSFVVPMVAAQWNGTGGPLTEAQFQAVLADVEALRIRAEWSTAVDTDNLDSVILTAPDPVPTTLVLSQTTTSGEVGSSHCVTATVQDAQGDAFEGVPVVFTTSGATSTAGTEVTDGSGAANYCYEGPALPGADTISAFGDTDSSSSQDPAEPGASALFTWIAPLSSDGCKVTLGGHVTDVTFGGNLRVKGGSPLGNLVVQEQGEDGRQFRVVSVSSLSCDTATGAVIAIGTLSINGGPSQPFRLDVTDAGEPGSADLFRLRVTGALDSGGATLEGGNIQLH